jgi:hypothetical protein
MAAAITTATATNITVAITGEIALFLDFVAFFRYLVVLDILATIITAVTISWITILAVQTGYSFR